MKLNFLIDKEQDRDFIYSLANKNMSEWAVDLETAQAMAQDIVAYSAEIARLRAALKEIADYDYQCQCTEGIEDGEEHFGCPSCWAKQALKEAK
jgi:hypothetical protein